jgi:hypothetical protein
MRARLSDGHPQAPLLLHVGRLAAGAPACQSLGSALIKPPLCPHRGKDPPRSTPQAACSVTRLSGRLGDRARCIPSRRCTQTRAAPLLES